MASGSHLGWFRSFEPWQPSSTSDPHWSRLEVPSDYSELIWSWQSFELISLCKTYITCRLLHLNTCSWTHLSRLLQLCLPIHQRVVVNISSAPVCIGCKYNTSMAWRKYKDQLPPKGRMTNWRCVCNKLPACVDDECRTADRSSVPRLASV